MWLSHKIYRTLTFHYIAYVGVNSAFEIVGIPENKTEEEESENSEEIILQEEPAYEKVNWNRMWQVLIRARDGISRLA